MAAAPLPTPGTSRAEVNALLVLALTRLEAARRAAEDLEAAVLAMERPSRFITPQAARGLVYRTQVAEQGCRFTVERLEGLGPAAAQRTVESVRGHDVASEVADAASDLLECLAADHGARPRQDWGPRVRACVHGLRQAVARFQAAETGKAG